MKMGILKPEEQFACLIAIREGLACGASFYGVFEALSKRGVTFGHLPPKELGSRWNDAAESFKENGSVLDALVETELFEPGVLYTLTFVDHAIEAGKQGHPGMRTVSISSFIEPGIKYLSAKYFSKSV
jgi:hypothetical protein